MKGLGYGPEAFAEGAKAQWNRHEFLKIDTVVRVLTTI